MSNNALITEYSLYLRAERYLKPQTIENYCYEIELFVNWCLINNSSTDFSTVDFNKYFAYRYNNKCYTNTYTNKIQQYLISFYNFLEVKRYICFNPAIKLDKARAEQRIPNIFYLYEIDLIQKQFSTSIKDLRDSAIVELLLSTGLRITEVLNLTVSHYINDNYNVLCKGDFERLIVINGTAKQKINLYLSSRSEKSKYVFCNKFGGRLSVSYFNKTLKTVCKNVGITKKVSAHTFRHTFASLLFEGGANIIEVKDLLGHQTVKSTEIYTKINIEHLRKEMRNHPRW